MDEQDTLEATAFALRAAGGQEPQEPLAVICGGETGVKIADALSLGFALCGYGWLKIEPPGDHRFQVLVHVSTCQGSIWGTYF